MIISTPTFLTAANAAAQAATSAKDIALILVSIAVGTAIIIKLLDSDEWSVKIGPFEIKGSKRNGQQVSEAELKETAELLTAALRANRAEIGSVLEAKQQVKSFMEAQGFEGVSVSVLIPEG